MPQAKQGDNVKVHYTGKFPNGEVFDSSIGRQPLAFTLGAGHVIAGFDKGIVGMDIGDKNTVHILPEDGYGLHYSEMVMAVDRNDFPPDIPLEIGQKLELGNPDGRRFNVTITEIDDESVTLDGNHPLAGKELVFDIELLSID